MGCVVSTRVVIGALALAAFVRPVGAQGPLRIIQRTPSDSATSGAEIGVTFDRPVAGSPDRNIDPRAIIRLEPALSGTAFWRDPVTLRFAPSAPLAPGTTLTITIDT